MINMDKLHKAVEYILWTGWIKNERPISLIIISKPESGKTSAIDKFKENNGVVYFNDVTPWGLVKELYKYKDLKKPINHIMIPDFLNIMAKSQTSSRALIHFFNSGMEEGISKVQTYGIQVEMPESVKFGVITAITVEEFRLRAKKWQNIGMLSRMIPFTYKYSIKGAQEVLESIFKQTYHNEEPNRIIFPKELVEVQLSEEIAKKMLPYSIRLANWEKLYGFRHQKQLQTLLKAVALSKGKTIVDDEDLKDLQSVAEYFNLEFNIIDEEVERDVAKIWESKIKKSKI